MSDYQRYLDQALKDIDIAPEKYKPANEDYDIYSEIAQQLVEARYSLGLSQKELAAKSGLTQANISKIESGTSHPTIDSLKKIADALGKRVSFQLISQEDLSDYD